MNVGWLAPGDQWDTTIVSDLLDGSLYPHGLSFRNWQGYPRTGGAVIVCPGRYWAGHEAEISAAISFYEWCLFIVTSDEEATFDAGSVVHQNCRTWIQTPRRDVAYPDGARFFGVGYTPHMRDLPNDPPIKDLDVFLSAQRTHVRREQAFDALKDSHLGIDQRVEETGGFTQGMPVVEYVTCMSRAKIAPAPSGAVSCDSFRAWEALQAHCVPIADVVSPVDGVTDYWQRILPDWNCPFPLIQKYSDLGGYVKDVLDDWPASGNRVTAWWMQYKRGLARGLREDLGELGAL